MTPDAEDNADPSPLQREFDVDGEVWVGEITGQCAVGGFMGYVAIDSIYIRRKDDRVSKVRLVYLPRGAFALLRDDELRALQQTAPPLAPRPTPEDGAGR